MPWLPRWIGASTGALVALAITAGMSHAKGPSMDRAEVRGPGIDGVAVVPDRYPYVLDKLLFDHLVGSNAFQDPPAGRLGIPYELRYYLELSGPDNSFSVELYPFAALGPTAYVPPGQQVGAEPSSTAIESGWYDYPPSVVRRLQDYGLPAQPAAASALDSARLRSRLLDIALIVLAAASTLGVAVVIGQRVRSRHSPRGTTAEPGSRTVAQPPQHVRAGRLEGPLPDSSERETRTAAIEL